MPASFLSLRFVALALVAVLVIPNLRGRARGLAFLVLNLLFAFGLVLGRTGTIVTLLFVVAGYVLVLLGLRRGRSGLAVGLILIVAAFLYVRQYDLLVWVLPDALLLRMVSTIGLSFVLFKIVHVMIDAQSGTLGTLDFLSFVNYCLNFTTFMMGPIQRYQDYRDQWTRKKESIPPAFEAHLDAMIRVLVGLAKAYVLAPFVSDRALQPNTDILSLNAVGLVVQTYAFWVYLYLNFSGYCDIVIGIGSLLGVRPPENFNKPFLARNISDFWLRQHRSLTLWLTEYVFSPLYKRLLSTPRTARHKILAANLSLMATMMVSGLWHGTTISFLLFGLVHGAYFVVYRSWDDFANRQLGKSRTKRLRENVLAHAGGILLTFNATAFAFIFFQLSPTSVRRMLSALVAS